MNHPFDRSPTQNLQRSMRRKIDRRRFLRRFGMGWLMVMGVGTVAGCGKPTQLGFRNVGSLKLLLEEGKIFDEHFSSEPLLVVRGPKKKGSKELGPIAALSPICPHQKCLVNWDKMQDSFVCPCHQSRFDITGKHLQGVAKADLKTYPIEIRGEEIWVSGRFQ
jgi:cytochrome b6-f complex iron-sulfur subunit